MASVGLYCYLKHAYRSVCFTTHSIQTRLIQVSLQPWSLITRVNIKHIYSLSAIPCRDSNCDHSKQFLRRQKKSDALDRSTAMTIYHYNCYLYCTPLRHAEPFITHKVLLIHPNFQFHSWCWFIFSSKIETIFM